MKEAQIVILNKHYRSSYSRVVSTDFKFLFIFFYISYVYYAFLLYLLDYLLFSIKMLLSGNSKEQIHPLSSSGQYVT